MPVRAPRRPCHPPDTCLCSEGVMYILTERKPPHVVVCSNKGTASAKGHKGDRSELLTAANYPFYSGVEANAVTVVP